MGDKKNTKPNNPRICRAPQLSRLHHPNLDLAMNEWMWYGWRKHVWMIMLECFRYWCRLMFLPPILCSHSEGCVSLRKAAPGWMFPGHPQWMWMNVCTRTNSGLDGNWNPSISSQIHRFIAISACCYSDLHNALTIWRECSILPSKVIYTKSQNWVNGSLASFSSLNLMPKKFKV